MLCLQTVPYATTGAECGISIQHARQLAAGGRRHAAAVAADAAAAAGQQPQRLCQIGIPAGGSAAGAAAWRPCAAAQRPVCTGGSANLPCWQRFGAKQIWDGSSDCPLFCLGIQPAVSQSAVLVATSADPTAATEHDLCLVPRLRHASLPNASHLLTTRVGCRRRPLRCCGGASTSSMRACRTLASPRARAPTRRCCRRCLRCSPCRWRSASPWRRPRRRCARHIADMVAPSGNTSLDIGRDRLVSP